MYRYIYIYHYLYHLYTSILYYILYIVHYILYYIYIIISYIRIYIYTHYTIYMYVHYTLYFHRVQSPRLHRVGNAPRRPPSAPWPLHVQCLAVSRRRYTRAPVGRVGRGISPRYGWFIMEFPWKWMIWWDINGIWRFNDGFHDGSWWFMMVHSDFHND